MKSPESNESVDENTVDENTEKRTRSDVRRKTREAVSESEWKTNDYDYPFVGPGNG